MIQPHCHEAEWINDQCKKMNAVNADIVERSIYAFNLLEGLVETGVDFVFKGGTSLLLHFDDPRRLSIDIDIVSNTDQEELENNLDEIVASRPFTRLNVSTTSLFTILPPRVAESCLYYLMW